MPVYGRVVSDDGQSWHNCWESSHGPCIWYPTPWAQPKGRQVERTFRIKVKPIANVLGMGYTYEIGYRDDEGYTHTEDPNAPLGFFGDADKAKAAAQAQARRIAHVLQETEEYDYNVNLSDD